MFMSGQKAAHVALNSLRRQDAEAGEGATGEEATADKNMVKA